jgi:hypothetical protein
MGMLSDPGQREQIQRGFRGLSAPRGHRPLSLRSIYWRLRAFSGLIVVAAFVLPAILAISVDRGHGAASGLISDVIHYRDCDEARAAGVAPIANGQPGYRPQLDADGDGIACEAFGW